MRLHYRKSGRGDPLLILHGVFGSSSNWNAIARRLAGQFQLFTLDLRNHGRSPHTDTMTYAEMAQDILDFMAQQGLESANIVGHSMGGKVAMTLALLHPASVRRLVVLDIAPVRYPDRFGVLLTALNQLDLAAVKKRADADKQLARQIPAPEVRAFLLQNLEKTPGGYRWRINLPVITRAMPAISDFPELAGRTFEGETRFVRGGDSDYIQDRHLPEIQRRFPAARMVTLDHASHWLHHEQPGRVTEIIREFLIGDK